MIVFFSNFISEHQIPLCDALYKAAKGDFYFVATEPIWEERLQLGFVDQSGKFPYIIKSYESESVKKRAEKLALIANIVILGDAPISFVEQRIKEGKITFKYSERFFKQGRLRIFDPRVFKGRYNQDIKYRNSSFYLLCAGAYVAGDASLIHSYPNKMFKWGYFPKTYTYENVDEVLNNKEKNSLLWVGRFIDWKHPEIPVKIAKALMEKHVNFSLTMAGTGEMVEGIQKMIKENNLEDYVQLTGALAPEDVRSLMENNELFIFSSDRNEGWGAVLNESMNAACVPIANEMIGSVPFLLKNGVNGYTYRGKNLNSVVDFICDIFNNPDRQRKMAISAYTTIVNQWNAENAAKRLLELVEAIENNKAVPFPNGVCSRAEII